jgi:hypothetical protein
MPKTTELERALLLLRDVSIGDAEPFALRAAIDASPKFEAALSALSVLGLVPSDTEILPPCRPPHIALNSKKASNILKWPEGAADVIATRAYEMWDAEISLSDERCAEGESRQLEPDDVPLWVAKGLALAGVDSNHLDVVRAHVADLGDAAAGNCWWPDPTSPRYDSSPQTVTLASVWAERIARGSQNALLAALIGICAGRAPCKDSAIALWILWIGVVRHLGQKVVNRSDEIGDALAMACVSPFLTADRSLPGEQAPRALRALAALLATTSQNAVVFAALSIGLDPGMDALATPAVALELVVAVIMLPTAVCDSILTNIQRIAAI